MTSTGLRIIGVSGCKDASLKVEIDRMAFLTDRSDSCSGLGALLEPGNASANRQNAVPSQKRDEFDGSRFSLPPFMLHNVI